jgi:sec-independent protein translocase protein TatB
MFPEGRLLDFLIVGAVALIVVGPKDLPVLMRKVGRFTARVRGMAAEFRASFDELARQSELDELRKEVEALRTARPIDYAAGQLGAGAAFSDIDASLAETHAALAGQTEVKPAASQPAAASAPGEEARPEDAAAAPTEATEATEAGAR